ncbi:protein serine threonine phosphatase 2C, partial [Coniophora puteana RWD-64-598 SS2]
MVYNTVLIPAATSTENLQALEEVKDFFTTDLGRGGNERWIYHILPEEVLDSKLVELADPQTRSNIDIITFQSCDAYESLNQDRFSAEDWDLPGGRWSFNAIYDGHCGHDTVEYVQSNFPSLVKASLERLLQTSGPGYLVDPSQVSRVLFKAVQQVDQSIVDALFRLFPQSQLEQMSEDEVEQHLHQHQSEWSDLAARCTQGSTVLAALSDPSRCHLWVVNLGDSQAVLGLRSPEADNGWSTKALSSSHNGNNPDERQRVAQEHPGEPHCLADNRLIGYLAPTRAIGDTWLKIPAIYTQKLFSRHCSDWLSLPRSQLFAS